MRKLADQIEAGEVESLVVACVSNGNYEFHFPSSLTDSLVLASLLKARCIENFRA